MNKKLLTPVLLFSFLLTSTLAGAQALTIGQIAFTGINTSNTPTDDFSFAILRTGGIVAGTKVRFTDKGWQSGTCTTPTWGSSAECEIEWTAGSGINKYGVQVRIFWNGTSMQATNGTVAIISGTWSLATGDQLFAYQGPFTAPTVMLAGLHLNIEKDGMGNVTTGPANWDNFGTITTGTNSNRPACLTNGTYAMWFSNATSDVFNARLKAITLTGTIGTDLANIYTPANWDIDINGTTPYPLPNNTLRGLPVDFTYIKALQKNSGVNVEFGIGTEQDIIDYTLEKSTDGRVYSDAGTISASGKKTYSLSDLQPVQGNNYYRIRAAEMDGSFKYSTVAVVNLSRGVKGVSVYPSLVKGNNFTLQINNLAAGNYKLNLVSAVGQTVLSRNLAHGGGSATQTVTLPATIQKGVYRVNVTNGSVNSVTTIVVE